MLTCQGYEYSSRAFIPFSTSSPQSHAPSSSSLLTSQHTSSWEQLVGCLGFCLSGWVFSSPPREAGVEKVGGSTHCGVSAQCAYSAHILSIPWRYIISFSYRGEKNERPKRHSQVLQGETLNISQQLGEILLWSSCSWVWGLVTS